MAALAVRALALLVPVAAAAGASVGVSHVVREPQGLAGEAAWLIGLAALSTTVLCLVERQARRLLPLAALLKLTLVFPDQAPSRFKSAIRIGSTRRLEKIAAQAYDVASKDESLNQAAVRILEMASALTAHDRRTRGHSERVRAYAELLADEMRLPAEDRNKLRWAALLHDVGKIGVDPAILNKDGKPTSDEWAVIKTHPLEGMRIIEPLVGWLGPFANAAWEHHERWDGAGYPLGLTADQISLSGRVVAVADAFEVMTATRSYKKPMSSAEARRELSRCAGTHFDPEVVRAMLNVSLGRIRRVMGPLSWIAQVPFLGWTAPIALNPTAAVGLGRTIALAGALNTVASVAAPAPAMVNAASHPKTAVEAAASVTPPSRGLRLADAGAGSPATTTARVGSHSADLKPAVTATDGESNPTASRAPIDRTTTSNSATPAAPGGTNGPVVAGPMQGPSADPSTTGITPTTPRSTKSPTAPNHDGKEPGHGGGSGAGSAGGPAANRGGGGGTSGPGASLGSESSRPGAQGNRGTPGDGTMHGGPDGSVGASSGGSGGAAGPAQSGANSSAASKTGRSSQPNGTVTIAGPTSAVGGTVDAAATATGTKGQSKIAPKSKG